MKMISSFKMFSVELLIQIFGEILKEPVITFFLFLCNILCSSVDREPSWRGDHQTLPGVAM